MKTQEFIDKWTDHPGENKAMARDIEALVADRLAALQAENTRLDKSVAAWKKSAKRHRRNQLRKQKYLEEAVKDIDGLREAQFKATKDLKRMARYWRDCAAGDYCQTYNPERGKGFNSAADMLEEYVNEALRGE